MVNFKIEIVAVSGPAPTVDQLEAFWAKGDGDRDGAIDWDDASRAVQIFNTSFGNPNFNPAYDFNKDGTIDMHDVGLISAHYGQTILDGTLVEADVTVDGPALALPVSTKTTLADPKANVSIVNGLVGTYTVSLGNQTKTLIIIDTDEGQTRRVIFYLPAGSTFDWSWIVGGVAIVGLGALVLYLYKRRKT